MRNTFINELCEAAESNKNIILIVGDLGYNVIEPFQKKFPDRFYNAGVCEQNMASMAAGLAREGFKVFIYSIANFPTFRCAEQIRNDVCYHNLDVTTVVVGGGVSYGNLGYSHHAVQDYGLMRLFPEISICSPGDPTELKAVMDFIKNDNCPKYLRLRKGGEKDYSSKLKFKKAGIWNEIRKSKNNKIILTTGNGLEIFNNYFLSPRYEQYGVYTAPIWGMKYKGINKDQIKKFDEIVTIEDHLIDGGFGSYILESCDSDARNKVIPCALSNNIIGEVGSENFLLNKSFERHKKI